jgi:acetyl esterase/lipase
MSIVLPLLNRWLRWTEKPQMARAKTPDKLRRSFELKSKLFFHAPLGTLMRWMTLGDVSALEVAPKSPEGQMHLLYFHGGAYIFGAPETHGAMIASLVKRTGGRAYLPAYRKAPEHPFPAAPDDAVACYRAMLEQGIDPRNIVIGGDSAGGGIALSVLGQLAKLGLPMPAGTFAFSPVVDMTYSSASVVENEAADVVLPASQIKTIQEMYLCDADPRDPLASPVFADFTGATPVWLVVGNTEILRDDFVRMAEHLNSCGVSVQFKMESDHPHVWPIFHNILPEARTTLDDLSLWIKQQLQRSAGN